MDPMHSVQTEEILGSQKTFPLSYFHFCGEQGPSKIFGTDGQCELSATRAGIRNAHGSSAGTMSALWQLIIKQMSFKAATKHRGNPHIRLHLSHCKKSRQQKILLIFFSRANQI